MADNLSVTRTYDRIFSIMRDYVEPVIFDNISTRTALLFRMKELGAIQRVGGREHLRFTILKELPSTEGYTDLDTITPVRADPTTSAIYEWKQLQCPIQVSGLDMIKTTEDGISNILELFIQSAEISLRDALGGSSLGIFSDGTESTLTKVSGLQTMLTLSRTTGTVGALSRANTSAWRHQYNGDSANDFSANGMTAVRKLYRECCRFDETPDTIVGTGAFIDNFEASATNVLTLNSGIIGPGDQAMLAAGYANLRYKNSLVFHDDGCPTDRTYFLNLAKYTRLIVREGRDAEIGDFVKSQSRDDLVSFILWAGNLITTNLARQGLLAYADTI